MDKINILRIIDDFSTLRDYRTGRLSISDLALFLGVPFALGGAVWWWHFNFDANVLNGMLAAFSIFAGLLLNLLVLRPLVCGQSPICWCGQRHRCSTKDDFGNS